MVHPFDTNTNTDANSRGKCVSCATCNDDLIQTLACSGRVDPLVNAYSL